MAIPSHPEALGMLLGRAILVTTTISEVCLCVVIMRKGDANVVWV